MPSDPIHFYAVGLPTCDQCGKPASARILGTGNVPYRFTCPRHENMQIRELERAHGIKHG